MSPEKYTQAQIDAAMPANQANAATLLPLLARFLVMAGSTLRDVYNRQRDHYEKPQMVKTERVREWRPGDQGDEYARGADGKYLDTYVSTGRPVRRLVEVEEWHAQPAGWTPFPFKEEMRKAFDAVVAIRDSMFVPVENWTEGYQQMQWMELLDNKKRNTVKVLFRGGWDPNNPSQLQTLVYGRKGADLREAYANAVSMETSPVPTLVVLVGKRVVSVACVPYNDANAEVEASVPVLRVVGADGTVSTPLLLSAEAAKPLYVTHELRQDGSRRYLTGSGFASDPSTREHTQFAARYATHLAFLLARAASIGGLSPSTAPPSTAPLAPPMPAPVPSPPSVLPSQESASEFDPNALVFEASARFRKRQ